MKRGVLIALVVVALLVTVLLINTARFTARQAAIAPIEPIALDEARLAQRLAEAVRFQTVSYGGARAPDDAAFSGFQQFLERAFPAAHASLTREVVGQHSLLFTWPGRGAQLKPALLMAHLDVVPVEQATEAQWAQPPFGGVIADGYIWGRGTMDDKGSVLGILEAVEELLRQGFQPERTVYLAFGHDEEAGGQEGAAQIAALLERRGVALEWVLDEGFFIADGLVPGVAQPVALIGIAEKGFVSLELTVEGEGGHSSVPPPHTTIGVLSSAIAELEANPMPGSIDGVVGQMFDQVGPEMPPLQRLAFANRWLFAPLIEQQLAGAPTTNALLRTTTAATMIEGGVKDNVLPSRARAVVNFRILPGDSIESVIAHVRATVGDPRVQIARLGAGGNEPSAVSRTDAGGYQAIQQTIRQVFPDALVAPGQVVAGTDSVHYARLTANIYRFVPQRYQSDDVERFHGVNERIGVADYAQSVRFYCQLIRNAAT